VEKDPTFWTIEYVMNLPEGDTSGLLCAPLPWEEGDTVGAAVMVYESRALAQVGLDHYLALIGAASGPASPYHLLPLGVRELVEILEMRPEEGFERVALNPIVSRYFPEAAGHSPAMPTDDFIKALNLLLL
jgi:hypothetical protein